MKKLSTNVRLKGPFDLPLSLAAAACFLPAQEVVPSVLRVGVRFGRRPAILEVRQIKRSPPVIEAFSTIAVQDRRLQDYFGWLVSSDLDLRQFYELVHHHPVMGPVTRSLKGLKPLRPLTLFEMVVIVAWLCAMDGALDPRKGGKGGAGCSPCKREVRLRDATTSWM
jgi:hypothetical protein